MELMVLFRLWELKLEAVPIDRIWLYIKLLVSDRSIFERLRDFRKQTCFTSETHRLL